MNCTLSLYNCIVIAHEQHFLQIKFQTFVYNFYRYRLQLAKTLRIVAAEGVDSLYSANGTLLRLVLKDLKSFGSIIEEEDFLSYR